MLADDARQIPGNSYGAQKAAAELILADASRRGFLDAVSLRLPTIIVRPGRPNRAASSFFSGIVREPLLGLPAELPVRGRLRRLGRQPAPRGRLAAARRRDGHRADGPGPQRQSARDQHDHRPSAAGAGRGAAGCIGAGARGWRTRRSPTSSAPGRRRSSRCARARSALPAMSRCWTWCARSSRTILRRRGRIAEWRRPVSLRGAKRRSNPLADEGARSSAGGLLGASRLAMTPLADGAQVNHSAAWFHTSRATAARCARPTA